MCPNQHSEDLVRGGGRRWKPSVSPGGSLLISFVHSGCAATRCCRLASPHHPAPHWHPPPSRARGSVLAVPTPKPSCCHHHEPWRRPQCGLKCSRELSQCLDVSPCSSPTATPCAPHGCAMSGMAEGCAGICLSTVLL